MSNKGAAAMHACSYATCEAPTCGCRSAHSCEHPSEHSYRSRLLVVAFHRTLLLQVDVRLVEVILKRLVRCLLRPYLFMDDKC